MADATCKCGHTHARHNIAKKPGDRYCMKDYCTCTNYTKPEGE